jgi:uncharacterized membrane protein YfcA
VNGASSQRTAYIEFGGALGVVLLAVPGLGLVVLIIMAPIEWQAVTVLHPASFAGGVSGASVAQHTPAWVLRTVVLCICTATAVDLLFT